MPLVRIDVQQGRSSAELRRIADVVQEVMLDVFAAPPRDRYQIITEHPVGHIIAEDTGLGFERTDGVVIIHVVQQGRSAGMEPGFLPRFTDRVVEIMGAGYPELGREREQERGDADRREPDHEADEVHRELVDAFEQPLHPLGGLGADADEAHAGRLRAAPQAAGRDQPETDPVPERAQGATQPRRPSVVGRS